MTFLNGKSGMKKTFWKTISIPLIAYVIALFCGAVARGVSQESSHADSVLTQLRKIPAATLADAVDQVTGERGFMDYDMRPVSETPRMAGRAKTVLLGPVGGNVEEESVGTDYAIDIMDESGPGDILVVANGSLNIAAFGGLKATIAKVRGMEGVVLDAATRDVEQIEELGLPVYARSITPATGVGREVTLARDIPVECAGVTVSTGDYLVGDRDGVVRIPAEHVDAVLQLALEYEETEKKMVPMLKELKSLGKVLEVFRRI